MSENEIPTSETTERKFFYMDFLRRNSSRLFESLSLARTREIQAQEKKLEPLEVSISDLGPSNQPLARKKKKLKKQQTSKKGETQIKQEDQRSVEELLEFINANDGEGTKNVKPSKQPSKRKRNRRKKNKMKDSSQRDNSDTDIKVDAQSDDIVSHNAITQEGSDQLLTDVENEEDELSDHEKMKENDRIVEEFAKKLSVHDYL